MCSNSYSCGPSRYKCTHLYMKSLNPQSPESDLSDVDVPPPTTTFLRQRQKREIQTDNEESITEKLKSIDMFPKAVEESMTNTRSGLFLTIVTVLLICVLIVHQVGQWREIRTKEHMVVDTTPNERLNITFDITFHRLQCSLCNFDVMDVAGEYIEDVSQGISRQRLNPDSSPIGEPYTDDEDISDVKGEGCRVKGIINVTKVAGNTHLAVGGVHNAHKSNTQDGSTDSTAPQRFRTRKHIHKFQMHQMRAFDARHTVHSLTFGNSYPGQAQPLSGTSAALNGVAHYQYFFKVIPTTYTSTVDGVTIHSNAYSVTEKATLIDLQNPAASGGIPGIFLIYDFSPFRVEIVQYRNSVLSFIVSLCAIVGGTLTIVGMVYSLLRHTYDAIVSRSAAQAEGYSALSSMDAIIK